MKGKVGMNRESSVGTAALLALNGRDRFLHVGLPLVSSKVSTV